MVLLTQWALVNLEALFAADGHSLVRVLGAAHVPAAAFGQIQQVPHATANFE